MAPFRISICTASTMPLYAARCRGVVVGEMGACVCVPVTPVTLYGTVLHIALNYELAIAKGDTYSLHLLAHSMLDGGT